MITNKNSCGSKIPLPPPPHNFSNGPSLIPCAYFVGHVFSVLAQWPLGWQDSIEYVGFAWVIIYFMFNLIKFSAIDERKLHR